jgi:hypothetical protein
MPAVFLRFEAPRMRVALPYASLLFVELALDEEELNLVFATHRVTLRGRKLARIHQAVCDGVATQVSVAANGLPPHSRTMPPAPWVGNLRVESVKNGDSGFR